MAKDDVRAYIRTIPNFPEEGVMFRDITSVLESADGLKIAIDEMQKCLDGVEFDKVAGLESRGFVFGMPIAYNMYKPFELIRKAGKLPGPTISESYDLEYGQAEIEIHQDAIRPGQKVVVVDDLIATGGTTEAMIKLVESLGGEVAGLLFLMELKGLKGRERLKNYRMDSALVYEGK